MLIFAKHMARHTWVDCLCLDQLIKSRVDFGKESVGFGQIARDVNEVQINTTALGVNQSLFINAFAANHENVFDVGHAPKQLDGVAKTACKENTVNKIYNSFFRQDDVHAVCQRFAERLVSGSAHNYCIYFRGVLCGSCDFLEELHVRTAFPWDFTLSADCAVRRVCTYNDIHNKGNPWFPLNPSFFFLVYFYKV